MPTNSPDPSLPDIERRIAALQQRIGDLATEDLPTAVAELQTLIDQARQLKIQIEGSENRIASDGSAIVEGDVGGDVNHSVTFIRNVYQQAPGRPEYDQTQFDAALERYLAWVEERYGQLNLRGVEKRHQHILSLKLDDVYVSLATLVNPERQWQKHPTQLDEQNESFAEPIDMRELLPVSPRLAIIGGPGSGKTTYLHLIAYTVAHGLRLNQVSEVSMRLGLHEPLPLPIVISLSDFNRYRRQCSESEDPHKGTLIAFISHSLIRQHAVSGLPNDFFERLLTQGRGCLLLLDGLDEVANERERGLVRRAVEELSHNKDVGQIVVTSRSRAYKGQAVLPETFRIATVQPISERQVDLLAERWCRAVYPASTASTETKRLQQAIHGLERHRAARSEARLADTPLMVTIIAIVHYNQRRMPDQRAELYEKCIEVLLAESHHPVSDANFELADWGGTLSEKRGLLAYLAFQMMRAGEVAGRTVSGRQLASWLRPLFARRYGEELADEHFERFVQAMRERGSLLSEQGGEYQFTHLTFQEFLCAYHLAENVREPLKIVTFLAEDGRLAAVWWRETALLAAGYLGLKDQETALRFLEGLVALPQQDGLTLAAAELAGTMLMELESQAATARASIVERLVTLLNDVTFEADHQLRMLAGDVLGKLGDPRPGVCTLEPDLIEIPSGTFVMGEIKPYTAEINQPYAISRYPVTNAQYRMFIEDGGYTDKWRSCWTNSGWAWKANRQQPWRWATPPWDGENQPAVGLTWYEAVAFVNWLSAKTGKPYRLPTEAEWERAARHFDGRVYPWGNEFDGTRLNSTSSGLGRTTAVGVFPAGAAECGALDMSGNVFEWCQTRYRDERGHSYPARYDADDGREELEGGDDVGRIRRGGFYGSSEQWLRCSSRYGHGPHGDTVSSGVRVVLSPLRAPQL